MLCACACVEQLQYMRECRLCARKHQTVHIVREHVHSTKPAEHYARQIFRKFGKPEISPRHRKQTIDQRQQQNQRKKRSADSTDFLATTVPAALVWQEASLGSAS